jgi:NAD(P)-dependent dehydrogenase (short-subunit alcohol dehydrogenase family)
VLTIEADVNNEDDVKRTIESTMKHFGQLDILVSLQFSGML